MENNSFMTVHEVAKELNVSLSYGYKLIRQLNGELSKKGMITIMQITCTSVQNWII